MISFLALNIEAEFRKAAHEALARIDRTRREDESVEDWAERLADDVKDLTD